MVEENKEQNKGQDYLAEAAALSYEPKPENDKEILSYVSLALELKLSTLDKAVAHYIRSMVYERQEHLLEAKTEIEKALEIDEKFDGNSPMCSSAWQHLALICEKGGDTAEAIKYLQKGINQLQTLFNPDEIKTLIALAYFDFARFYIRHDEIKSTVEQCFLNLERAIKIDPKFPDPYFLLGALHSDNYNPRKAIEYYERYLVLVDSSDSSEIKPRKEMAQEKLKVLKREIESETGKPIKEEELKKKGFFKKLFG